MSLLNRSGSKSCLAVGWCPSALLYPNHLLSSRDWPAWTLSNKGKERGGEKGRQRDRERQRQRVEDIFRPKLEPAQCHFGCILLAKASHMSTGFKKKGNRLSHLVGEMKKLSQGKVQRNKEAITWGHQLLGA